MAGLTANEVAEFLGEGFHTALRKAVPDSEVADQIWRLIADMDDSEWSTVLHFVTDPLIEYIREQGLA